MKKVSKANLLKKRSIKLFERSVIPGKIYENILHICPQSVLWVAFIQDYEAELELLRAQVQKYRNELTNRETNFNRMFTEKQPVNLSSKRGVRLSVS